MLDSAAPTGARPVTAVRRAVLTGAALAIVAFGAGLPGLAEIGVTWDEPRYFQSVERIRTWTSRVASGEAREAISAEAIREAWDSDRYYNPHPPFYKAAMAATGAVLGGRLGAVPAYRMSSLLMFALLVGLVAGTTAALVRPAAGLGAGASLLLMPRVFGHAHIAATDIPLSLFWFAATIGMFLHLREGGSRGWLVLAAVAFGCGMATKFTAFLLPIPLAAWALFGARRRATVTAFLYGTALALVVSILVNPAAWPNPIGYVDRLIEDSLVRDRTIPIDTYYLGRIYAYVVPWHHAIVMTAATLPLGITALAAVGLKAAAVRGRTRSLALLCVVQIAFWWALLALPGSPNHDGVRLWLPTFPFVAVLAGIGFGILAGALERRFAPRTARLALVGAGLLFLGPAALGTVRASPYYLSYYGELVGGPSGAAELGLEATYWFDAVTAGFRDRLHETLPEGAVVVAHPNAEYYVLLQDMGLIRRDLRFTRAPPADFMLILARRAMLTGGWASVYDRSRPLLAAELDGVELVGLYRFNEPASGPEIDAEGESP